MEELLEHLQREVAKDPSNMENVANLYNMQRRIHNKEQVEINIYGNLNCHRVILDPDAIVNVHGSLTCVEQQHVEVCQLDTPVDYYNLREDITNVIANFNEEYDHKALGLSMMRTLKKRFLEMLAKYGVVEVPEEEK